MDPSPQAHCATDDNERQAGVPSSPTTFLHPEGCCQFSTIEHSVSRSLCWRPPGFCSPSRQWQGPTGLITGDKCM